MAWAWGSYALVFLLAKATAFAGPLLIAYVSAPAVYGAIELAFGYGLLLGPFLTLGTVIAAPQHILMEDDHNVLDRMAISVLGATVAGLGFAVLAAVGELRFWLDNPMTTSLIALMVGPSAAQIALSTYSRTCGWKSAAAWLDNTATHLLWITGLSLFAIAGQIELGALVASYLAAALLITVLCGWVAATSWTRPFATRFRHSLIVGVPMMLNGVAIFLVMGATRVLIGTFIDAEAVAGYAFLFRITGIILLIHQFFMTAWAVDIYKNDSQSIDRKIAVFCALMSTAGLVVFYVLNLPSVRNYFPDFVDQDDVLLIGLTTLQVVLWSLSASLEPRVNRLLQAGRMAILTGVVGLGLLAAVAFLSSLEHIAVPGVLTLTCIAQGILIIMQLAIGREKDTDGLKVTARTIFVGPTLLLAATILMDNYTWFNRS